MSVNSAAVQRPELVAEIAEEFGSQCCVVAIDAKHSGPDSWHVFVKGGREDTGIDAVEILARIADHQTTHDGIGRHDGDHLALSAAIDNGAGAANKLDPRPVDKRRPAMHAGSEHKNIAVTGCGERLNETPAAGFDGQVCRVCPRQTAGREYETGRCRQAYDKIAKRHQAPFGLTSMRPRISIWRAWQNHWQ